MKILKDFISKKKEKVISLSNKEIEDLKTLIKSLDIRLKNDEISSGEYKELKQKYEHKLEEQINLIKEKSLLRGLSYISISGSGKVTDSQINISGSGHVEGWRGGSISISGSGSISDEEIRISGSGTLPGDMKTEKLVVSGSFKANGALEANSFTASGSFKIDGPLTVHEKLNLSGAGKIEGSVSAENAALNCSGALKINGNLTCFDAEINGTFKINGDVNCSKFTCGLEDKSSIEGNLICLGDIYIEQEKRKGTLTVNQIISEGKVYLEGVKADYVIGTSVKIGPNCEIKNFEEKTEN